MTKATLQQQNSRAVGETPEAVSEISDRPHVAIARNWIDDNWDAAVPHAHVLNTKGVELEKAAYALRGIADVLELEFDARMAQQAGSKTAIPYSDDITHRLLGALSVLARTIDLQVDDLREELGHYGIADRVERR